MEIIEKAKHDPRFLGHDTDRVVAALKAHHAELLARYRCACEREAGLNRTSMELNQIEVVSGYAL